MWLVFRQQPYGQEMPFHQGSPPPRPSFGVVAVLGLRRRNGGDDAVNLCLN